MRLVLFTKDFSDNSTGRAYVLWLLAKSLGWEATVVSFRGETVWAPLSGTEFAESCVLLDSAEMAHSISAPADLLISVKPVPGALDRALDASRATGKPLLVDIDDPDLESLLGQGSLVRAAAKAVLRARTFWPSLRLRAALRKLPRMVSNPALARRYGGEIVPHARNDFGFGAPQVSWTPSVVFVGTNRKHKGTELLRRAVEAVAGDGFTLTITDHKPADALPHERWVGPTSLEEGIELVRSSDIVVIPSRGGDRFAAGQLPAKLVDAMMAGRAVVVSDLPPLAWAIGTEGGMTFPPDDVNALEEVLRRLSDPATRERIATGARQRALELFTTDAVARRFAKACAEAVKNQPRAQLR